MRWFIFELCKFVAASVFPKYYRIIKYSRGVNESLWKMPLWIYNFAQLYHPAVSSMF